MWRCKGCGTSDIQVIMIPALNEDGTYECCHSEHKDYQCGECGDTSEFIDDIAEWEEE